MTGKNTFILHKRERKQILMTNAKTTNKRFYTNYYLLQKARIYLKIIRYIKIIIITKKLEKHN